MIFVQTLRHSPLPRDTSEPQPKIFMSREMKTNYVLEENLWPNCASSDLKPRLWLWIVIDVTSLPLYLLLQYHIRLSQLIGMKVNKRRDLLEWKAIDASTNKFLFPFSLKRCFPFYFLICSNGSYHASANIAWRLAAGMIARRLMSDCEQKK